MFRAANRFLRQLWPLPPEDDLQTLLARQRFLGGLLASLLMAVLTVAAWVQLSLILDRYFPWYPVVQGLLIGIAMRRFGRGLDFRFPLAAAVVTTLAAAGGSFVVALYLTGDDFRTNPWLLVSEISTHTVNTFYRRDFGSVGVIYTTFAALLAAFFAKRRLRRNEAIAWRRYREGSR